VELIFHFDLKRGAARLDLNWGADLNLKRVDTACYLKWQVADLDPKWQAGFDLKRGASAFDHKWGFAASFDHKRGVKAAFDLKKYKQHNYLQHHRAHN